MHSRKPSAVERIFENIIFIDEVSGYRPSEEVPDVPFLELARSFEVHRSETESKSTNLTRKKR